MDAGYTNRRRESEKSQREKRWSMNSQRLEEIVAELMKPISDIRRSFDTDLSALLEEYLTEAGLRALEESDDEDGGAAAVKPNFTELALLVQQSANIYGRKVDCLYQHVLSVSEALQCGTQDSSGATAEPQTPSGRRKRRGSAAAALEFVPIELTACAGARREASTRPPPTLARGYIELAPRILGPGDASLEDYAGEAIGVLADYEVAWRLQDGLLVDELQRAGGAGAAGEGRLRAVPLAELQAALVAAAPPDPPPDDHDHDDHDVTGPMEEPQRPLACSTPQPLPAPPTPPPFSPPPPPPPLVVVARGRKRRSDMLLEELVGVGKLLISDELRARLAHAQEFSLPGAWVARVVARRKERVLAARVRLRDRERRAAAADFRGFDITDSVDIGGFLGWSETEAALAARAVRDSDDDGFFEQSSSGDSDDCAAPPPPPPPLSPPPAANAPGPPIATDAELAAWRDAVLARADEGRAADAENMLTVGLAVLRAADELPSPAPLTTLLASAMRHGADLPCVFLATLVLANAGNVELVQGPPLMLNSGSVRLLSQDQSLYIKALNLDR